MCARIGGVGPEWKHLHVTVTRSDLLSVGPALGLHRAVLNRTEIGAGRLDCRRSSTGTTKTGTRLLARCPSRRRPCQARRSRRSCANGWLIGTVRVDRSQSPRPWYHAAAGARLRPWNSCARSGLRDGDPSATSLARQVVRLSAIRRSGAVGVRRRRGDRRSSPARGVVALERLDRKRARAHAQRQRWLRL